MIVNRKSTQRYVAALTLHRRPSRPDYRVRIAVPIIAVATAVVIGRTVKYIMDRRRRDAEALAEAQVAGSVQVAGPAQPRAESAVPAASAAAGQP